jgi:hypothetical protein
LSGLEPPANQRLLCIGRRRFKRPAKMSYRLRTMAGAAVQFTKG